MPDPARTPTAAPPPNGAPNPSRASTTGPRPAVAPDAGPDLAPDAAPEAASESGADASPQHGYHYALMRRAMNLIDSAETPLNLSDLASQMGMSTAHFQRLFSAWVGVSPKRYQQYLALNHARDLLTRRHSTLQTALETGLSGSGRLHDLFLRWEAMSPGEYALGGAGLTIRWADMATPFGAALVMATEKGLCGIAFTAETGRDAAWADMTARWPAAQYVQDAAHVAQLAEPAFARRGETRLHMLGAPFQIKVWEALLAIPSGHVSTYSDLAQAVGTPRAVRAVGTAVGRNPVSFLIPCHRAIRKSGGLGGYHWGLPAWESAGDDAGSAPATGR